MQIKSVENNKVSYPTIKEMKYNKIKNSIPNKWKKLGITVLFFDILMKNKVLAISKNKIETDMQVTAGVLPYYEYNPTYKYIESGCKIFTIVSILAFILGLITIKVGKKQKDENKIIKRAKILLIVSILLFVLSRIGLLAVNNLKGI